MAMHLKLAESDLLTGGAAVYGQAVKNATELAVNEINAARWQVQFEFQFEDDEHDAEKSVNAYNSTERLGHADAAWNGYICSLYCGSSRDSK